MMGKVKIHTLFQYLLDAAEAQPRAVVGFSLSASPRLGEFLGDLDPDLPLDWNGVDFRGLPMLRDRVLAQAGLTGVCAANDVLITAGAAEANYLVLRQLLEPGDEIVVEHPGWPQAEVLAQAMDVTVRRVARDEGAEWALLLDALAEAVTPRTKLIFLTNPNNPTGALMDLATLDAIVDIARDAGAWLLVDEVYAGLEWSGPRSPSVAGMYERGITTGSVSKALGLQGLRTGWLICRNPELVMDAVILRENGSEIMNVLGEHIACAALEPVRLAAALDKARAEGRANLDHMSHWLAATDGLTWVPPAAGLIGLAKLRDGIDSDAFAGALLAEPYRTFILPGSAYDLPGYVRLGVGGGAEVNLQEGLTQVAALLSTLGDE